jgi:hypothetical protein
VLQNLRVKVPIGVFQYILRPKVDEVHLRVSIPALAAYSAILALSAFARGKHYLWSTYLGFQCAIHGSMVIVQAINKLERVSFTLAIAIELSKDQRQLDPAVRHFGRKSVVSCENPWLQTALQSTRM